MSTYYFKHSKFWFIGQSQISVSIVIALDVFNIILILGKIKNMNGVKNYV